MFGQWLNAESMGEWTSNLYIIVYPRVLDALSRILTKLCFRNIYFKGTFRY